MKIKSRSLNRLEILIPQYLLRLVGLMFIIIGGGMWVFMQQSYLLQCHRPENEPLNTCQFIKKYTFFSQQPILIKNLEKASLSTHNTSEGNTTFNIRLQTPERSLKLSTINSNNQQLSQFTVHRINTYLRQPDNKSLSIPSIHSAWLKGFLFIFPLLGCLMIFMPSRVSLTFNKTSNQFKILRKNLFSKTEEHYPLDKIKSIDIQDSYTDKGQICYRLAITLQDNTLIPLTTTYDSLLEPKLKTAQTISDFLGLDFKFEALEKKASQQKVFAGVFFIIGLIIIFIIFMT